MENSKTIKYVLIAIIIGLAILFLYRKQENLDASGLSNEALQNIAKVYGDKDGTVTFNNLNTTNKANINNLTTTGDTNIGPIHFDSKGFNSKNMFFNNDTSEFNTRGNIQAQGNIDANSITTRSIDNTSGYTRLWDVKATQLTVDKITLGGYPLDLQIIQGIPYLRFDNKIMRYN